MTRWTWSLLAALCCTACPESKTQPTQRAELRRMSGSTFELIPSKGQLPYCLLYSRSDKGVIRQLTLTHSNRSIPCPADKPLFNTRFRVPTDEGKAKLFLFFSDEQLNAASLAQQLLDGSGDPAFNPMNLRLPGRVAVETFEFVPEKDVGATEGAVVGTNGNGKPEDAGADATTPAP